MGGQTEVRQWEGNPFWGFLRGLATQAGEGLVAADPTGSLGKPFLDLSGWEGLKRTLERLQYGERLTTGRGETLNVRPDTLDAVGLAAPALDLGLRGLGKAAQLVGENAFSGPVGRAAQRGALTLGGDPKAIPAHATTTDALEAANKAWGGSTLYSPSLGITYDKVPEFKDLYGQGNVFLIPKIGAFDPATSSSTLFNRDAYLPRHGQFTGVANPTGPNLLFDRGLARSRLAKNEKNYLKITPEDLPELIKPIINNSHEAAIHNSPHFPSFAAYERSPAGLATLKRGRDESVIDTSEAIFDEYGKVVDELIRRHYPDSTVADRIEARKVARALLNPNRNRRIEFIAKLQARDPVITQELVQIGANFRRKFAELPSDYAELQHYGLTPLTEENWAGAFVVGGGREADRLRKVMGLPIEPVSPGQLSVGDIQTLQAQRGLARRMPVGQPRAGARAPKLDLDAFYGQKNWDTLLADHEVAQKLFTKFPDGPPSGELDQYVEKLPYWSQKAVIKHLNNLVLGKVKPDIPSTITVGADTYTLPKADKHTSDYWKDQIVIHSKPGTDMATWVAEQVDSFKLGLANGYLTPEAALPQIAAIQDAFKALAKPKSKGMTEAEITGDWTPEEVNNAIAGKALKSNFDWLESADYIPPDQITPLTEHAVATKNFDLWSAIADYDLLPETELGAGDIAHQLALGKIQEAFHKGKGTLAAEKLPVGDTPGPFGNPSDEISDKIIKDIIDSEKAAPTSTGDAALDGEIDDMAKAAFGEAKGGLWLAKPTAAASAKSFIQHAEEDVDLPPMDIAQNFVELFKEAGGGNVVIDPSGEIYTFYGAKGGITDLTLDELAAGGADEVLKKYLPEVYQIIQDSQ